MSKTSRVPAVLAAALVLAGCASMPLYPPRPAATPGAPVADPAPSKVVVHVTVTPEGLNKAIDEALPLEGTNSFTLQGQREWKWKRSAIDFKFADGKLVASATLAASVALPLLGMHSLSLDLKVSGEPVIGSDYRARLQSPKVELTSKDLKLKMMNVLGGALTALRDQFQTILETYSYDLSPKVLEQYQRLAAPIALPLGDAEGCLSLRVTGLEAGPTVLAGGIEKDVALIVAPTITLPCAPPSLPVRPAPLANVATLASGPFTVTVPIAASYSELTKAMSLAFTDGKLYFSKDFPQIYLTDPEVYSSQNQLVLKLRLGGPVQAAGISANLDGDIFFSGHPAVIDNELQIPDLQPTIETGSFLLKLKAALDGDSIRDQARAALKLDLSERLRAARAKVSGDMPVGPACLRSDVPKIEVTGVYPHGSYLRIYVAVTAQTSLYLPCPLPAEKPLEEPTQAPAPAPEPAAPPPSTEPAPATP